LLAALAAVTTFFLAGPLSAGNEELKVLIQITAAVVLPSIVLLVPRAVIAGTHNWRLLSIERALFGAIRLGWILFLWLTGTLTPLSATVAWVVSPLVSGLVFFPVALRVLRAPEAATDPDRVSWRIITGYGLRIWLGALSGIVLTRISQVLMVPLSSEAQAGLFAVAVTIGEIPLIISGAVRDVTFSTDSAMASDERLQQTCRITLQMTFLVSLGIGVTMPLWLPLLFGADFATGIPAALIVLAATVIGSPGSVAGSGLSARGRPGLRSWSMAVGACANLAVLLTATPRLGAVGAALSMLVGSFFAGNGNIYFLHRYFGLPWRRYLGVRAEDRLVYAALTRKVLSFVR
jgi:O-antigen/teichoic acid export membrane protein